MVGSILRQAVIELQGQTRHMPCVCEIRIKECSPGLNTQQNGGLNLLALRQCGAPNAPERVSAERAGCQAAAAEPGALEFRSNSAIASRQIAARLQVPAL